MGSQGRFSRGGVFKLGTDGTGGAAWAAKMECRKALSAGGMAGSMRGRGCRGMGSALIGMKHRENEEAAGKRSGSQVMKG